MISGETTRNEFCHRFVVKIVKLRTNRFDLPPIPVPGVHLMDWPPVQDNPTVVQAGGLSNMELTASSK
jgi:hypothetical protein